MEPNDGEDKNDQHLTQNYSTIDDIADKMAFHLNEQIMLLKLKNRIKKEQIQTLTNSIPYRQQARKPEVQQKKLSKKKHSNHSALYNILHSSVKGCPQQFQYKTEEYHENPQQNDSPANDVFKKAESPNANEIIDKIQNPSNENIGKEDNKDDSDNKMDIEERKSEDSPITMQESPYGKVKPKMYNEFLFKKQSNGKSSSNSEVEDIN